MRLCASTGRQREVSSQGRRRAERLTAATAILSGMVGMVDDSGPYWSGPTKEDRREAVKRALAFADELLSAVDGEESVG